jgi:sulfur carrier protein ThiS
MQIVVKLFGTVRRFSQSDTPGVWQGEVPAHLSLSGLIQILGTQDTEIAAAAINGEVVPLGTEIPAGATVTLVTPVGGGGF